MTAKMKLNCKCIGKELRSLFLYVAIATSSHSMVPHTSTTAEQRWQRGDHFCSQKTSKTLQDDTKQASHLQWEGQQDLLTVLVAAPADAQAPGLGATP